MYIRVDNDHLIRKLCLGKNQIIELILYKGVRSELGSQVEYRLRKKCKQCE